MLMRLISHSYGSFFLQKYLEMQIHIFKKKKEKGALQFHLRESIDDKLKIILD